MISISKEMCLLADGRIWLVLLDYQPLHELISGGLYVYAVDMIDAECSHWYSTSTATH